jgi:hypothetical protein
MSSSGEQKPEAPAAQQGRPPSGPRRRGRGRRGRGRRAPPPAAPVTAAGSAPEALPVELATQPAVPAAPEPETARSAISRAIDEVGQIVESLKAALDQMEDVLELVELAERQKIDDEREIETLRQALRQLHRPREGGQKRGPAGHSPAPAPADAGPL